MSNEQQADRPQIFDINKYVMFADTPGVQGNRSRFVWGIRDGNPRISVFTNDPKDTISRGVIFAGFNPETFFIFLNLFRDIIKGPNGGKGKVEQVGPQRDAQGNILDGGTKVVQSELQYGKDDAGMCWIRLVAPQRPVIKFVFKISDYHRIFKQDGTQYTEAEASALQAYSVINTIWDIYKPLTGEFRKPMQQQSNQSTGTQSNAKQPSNYQSEDMPF